MTLHERQVGLQKNGSAQNCKIWPLFTRLFMRHSYLELSYVHTFTQPQQMGKKVGGKQLCIIYHMCSI